MGNGITQVTAAAGYNVTMVRRGRAHAGNGACISYVRALPVWSPSTCARMRSLACARTHAYTLHARVHRCAGGRDAGAPEQVDGEH
jgi:hypothetical protein